MSGEVVDLSDFRERGLSSRQREVLRRVEAGAECDLCGDLGAVVDPNCGMPNAGRPTPCIVCGKRGEPVPPAA